MSRLTSATTAKDSGKDYDYAEVQMRPRSRDSSDCSGLLPFALRESFEGGPLAEQHVELLVELLTSYIYMYDCIHAVVLVCDFLEVPEILSLTALNRSTHAGDVKNAVFTPVSATLFTRSFPFKPLLTRHNTNNRPNTSVSSTPATRTQRCHCAGKCTPFDSLTLR